MTKHRLFLIGMGPGTAEWMTLAAWNRITKVSYIFASERLKDMLVNELAERLAFDHSQYQWRIFDGKLTAMVEPLLADLQKGDTAVLCTGDTGIFSIASWLSKVIAERSPNQQIEWLPGISSLQYFTSRLQRKWNDLNILSLHGREPADLERIFKQGDSLALFTDPLHSPRWIAEALVQYGRGDDLMSCGFRLSYDDEEIVTGTVKDFLSGPIEEQRLCLVIVEATELVESTNKNRVNKQIFLNENADLNIPAATTIAENNYTIHLGAGFAGGLPDEAFVRGKRPMTKSVIRSRLVSLLNLTGKDCVWDIGAGTGSCSVEIALLSQRGGHVFAIEVEPEGVQLIQQNGKKFGVNNLTVVDGEAPEIFAGLPLPDRAFIGGSGGRLEDILRYLTDGWHQLNRTTGKLFPRIVVSGVTLETPYQAIKLLQKYHFAVTDIEQIQVNSYRNLGRVHMPKAENPIWLIAADWRDDTENMI